MPMLLYVLGLEESQLGVAIGGWGMAIEGCMHVVVCSVFSPPLFALATGFRFTAISLLHERHCMSCLPLPPFEFANGFCFTAIPLSHKCHCLFCIPLPLYVLAHGFRFTAIPLLHDFHYLFCIPLPLYVFANGFRFTAIALSHECHYLFCIPVPLFGGPKIALRGGHGMGAGQRRGGAGVPEMGFRAGPFVSCKDGCCHQRCRNTNFGLEKNFFTEKFPPTFV